MRYIVTDKGPIDRNPPGADVSKLYMPATLARLVEEGYVMDADAEKAKPSPKKKGDK